MTYGERTTRIKNMIAERLNLVMDPDDIADDAPLYAGGALGGLALDAVDARTLALGMRAEFGVSLRDEDMSVFESVARMTRFVQERLAGV